MLLNTKLNAKTVITNVREGDVQPNATDIRLDRVWRFDQYESFKISDDYKGHVNREEIHTGNELAEDDWFYLSPGSYEISFENKIKVAEGEAGWVITRSTLNRNGVFITSGLYDSGYSGPMAAALHVAVPTHIKRGTRIGQYITVSAETSSLYDGDYGKGTEHDKHL